MEYEQKIEWADFQGIDNSAYVNYQMHPVLWGEWVTEGTERLLNVKNRVLEMIDSVIEVMEGL